VHVEHTHIHRHLSHIVKMIEKAAATPRAKRDAIAVFQKLGEAEAQVHQFPSKRCIFTKWRGRFDRRYRGACVRSTC